LADPANAAARRRSGEGRGRPGRPLSGGAGTGAGRRRGVAGAPARRPPGAPMTTPMALTERERPPWRIRLVAHVAVVLARLLARQPPGRIRRLLLVIRRGGRPATGGEAGGARRRAR